MEYLIISKTCELEGSIFNFGVKLAIEEEFYEDDDFAYL